MAYEGALRSIPGATASADLSAAQFKYITMDGTGGTAVVAATAGEVTDGVLQDKPSAAGEAANVAFSGVSKVYAGATVVAGVLVQADATGRAITAASADYHGGRALTGGAVGEIISVLLDVRGHVA